MRDEKIESKAAFKRRMEAMKLPKGFTARFETTSPWQGVKPQLIFILEKEGDCKLEFRHESGDGTTTFHTAHGERTFDRTGVESSFYHRPFSWEKPKKAVSLNELVKEQLDKIEARRAYINTSISIPGIPFRIQQKDVEEYKKELKKVGYIRFMPSGFGTGYQVTTKPTRALRYSEKRATPELETFFGHSPLFVSTMDCD